MIQAGKILKTFLFLVFAVPKGYRPPIFLEELEAILTSEGTVSLECKVVGVPTPILKWYKDGNEIKAGIPLNHSTTKPRNHK